VRRLQLSDTSVYRQQAGGFLLTDSATSLTTTKTTTTTRKCDKFFLRVQHHSPTKCPGSCGGLRHIFIYRQPSSSFQTSPPRYWRKGSLVQEIGTLSITWCPFSICACAVLLLEEIFYLCEANWHLNLSLHKRHKNTNILVVFPVQCQEIYQCFERTGCLYIQHNYKRNMKTKALVFSETSVNFRRTTLRHITGNGIPETHRHRDLKPHKKMHEIFMFLRPCVVINFFLITNQTH
jgi:hypothetical protein